MTITYPDRDDLTARIESLGVIDTDGKNFDLILPERKIAAAIASWEKRTGWTPFLAGRDSDGNAVETTRPFDAPDGRTLQLRGGLLSCSSVTVFGSPLVIGQDCYLRPSDAPSKHKPYTEIYFMSRVSSRIPECVAVTGVWGRCLGLADVADAWEAILGQACALCAPEIALNISAGLYKVDDKDGGIQYASGSVTPLAVEKAMWEKYFDGAASDNKRTTV